MRERILNDLKTAMKNQDKDTLKVIRMVKGSMQLVEIDLKHELNDDEVISIISKEIKTRRDSIKEFEKGNRQDLVDETEKEIAILEKYLPEQLRDDKKLATNGIRLKPATVKVMAKKILKKLWKMECD